MCRSQLNFGRLPDQTYDKLKEEATTSKQLGVQTVDGGTGMKAAYSYNMLAQSTYYNKYMYIPYTQRNRKDYIVSMYKNDALKKLSVDVVRMASDLAYLPIGQAKELNFDPPKVYMQLKRIEKENAEPVNALL